MTVTGAATGAGAGDVQATGPSLEIADLTVAYGNVVAVRNLSLTVAPGEVVGLIGPNGAGKSTTLHTIMGVVRPKSGDILLCGRSIVGRRPGDVARAGITLAPEGRRLFAALTVEENLLLGLSGRRTPAGADEAVEAAYAMFPVVRDFRKRHAGALSGGQQQQLAIARALVAAPDVLLLDEPSLGLAPVIVDVVFEALAQVRERGLAVLLIEQRAQRTVAFSDRTYLIANGEVRLTLTPADAGETDKMISAYLA